MFFGACFWFDERNSCFSYLACRSCERALSENQERCRVAYFRNWACKNCQFHDLTAKPWESIQQKKRQFKLKVGVEVFNHQMCQNQA